MTKNEDDDYYDDNGSVYNRADNVVLWLKKKITFSSGRLINDLGFVSMFLIRGFLVVSGN